MFQRFSSNSPHNSVAYFTTGTLFTTYIHEKFTQGWQWRRIDTFTPSSQSTKTPLWIEHYPRQPRQPQTLPFPIEIIFMIYLNHPSSSRSSCFIRFPRISITSSSRSSWTPWSDAGTVVGDGLCYPLRPRNVAQLKKILSTSCNINKRSRPILMLLSNSMTMVIANMRMGTFKSLSDLSGPST